MRSVGLRCPGNHFRRAERGGCISWGQTLPLIAAIARKIPPRHDYLPRMCRAAASKVLNTAEGAAELSPGDKARFYRMAHRSTAELAAILRLLDALQIVTMPEIGSADPTCNGSASCSSG